MMDEMKPMLSIGETLHDYFTNAMLEQLSKPGAYEMLNSNIRNEAYYESQNVQAFNPTTHCAHCGKPYEAE